MIPLAGEDLWPRWRGKARRGQWRGVDGGVEGGRGSAGRAVTPDISRPEHPQSRAETATDGAGLTIKLDYGVTAWRWTCQWVEEEEM